jgi:membrane protein implicated in regulation of membrane protease activity
VRIGDGGAGDALGAGAVVIVAGGAAAGAGATDHTSAYLTFAGAVIVAVITAVTTNRRQERQLADEHVRLEEQLTARSSSSGVRSSRKALGRPSAGRTPT